MLRGGRCTADKSHWRVGSARSVWAALGLPTHGVCAFPVDTARAPGCPAGELSKAGPGLRALPRAKPLRFGFSGTPHGRKRGWACAECPSPSEQLRGPGAWRALSLGAVLSPPLSQPSQVRCAACLFWGTDLWLLPSRRMSSVQDPRKARLATGSLLAVWWRMLSLGLRLPLDFWLWLSPTCLSASSRGMGWSAAGQLSFSIHSILCSVSGPGCAFG